MQNYIWFNLENAVGRNWYNSRAAMKLLSFVISKADIDWRVRFNIEDQAKIFDMQVNQLLLCIDFLLEDKVIKAYEHNDLITIELIDSDYVRISKP